MIADLHPSRDRRGLLAAIDAGQLYWSLSGLLVTACRLDICPADLAPQYAGHDLTSSASPWSASRRSSVGSSLAHSRANLLRLSRSSFSAKALSMA